MIAQFSRPMMHPNLRTWSANIVIPVGDYLISYTGDDGCSRSKDVSIRHYLMVTHKDNSSDLTEKLGFETYGDIDLLAVIDKIRSL